jgi:methionyl-tRNA synthetase
LRGITYAKEKNLLKERVQTLLFRCLETGFITTSPALTRYQKARGVDPSQRDLVGERPSNWVKEVPSTTCEHCGMEVKGNQWAFRQHKQSKRCLAFREEAA